VRGWGRSRSKNISDTIICRGYWNKQHLRAHEATRHTWAHIPTSCVWYRWGMNDQGHYIAGDKKEDTTKGATKKRACQNRARQPQADLRENSQTGGHRIWMIALRTECRSKVVSVVRCSMWYVELVLDTATLVVMGLSIGCRGIDKI